MYIAGSETRSLPTLLFIKKGTCQFEAQLREGPGCQAIQHNQREVSVDHSFHPCMMRFLERQEGVLVLSTGKYDAPRLVIPLLALQHRPRARGFVQEDNSGKSNIFGVEVRPPGYRHCQTGILALDLSNRIESAQSIPSFLMRLTMMKWLLCAPASQPLHKQSNIRAGCQAGPGRPARTNCCGNVHRCGGCCHVPGEGRTSNAGSGAQLHPHMCIWITSCELHKLLKSDQGSQRRCHPSERVECI